MELDPESYTCEEHTQNLTAAVLRQLEDEVPVLSYRIAFGKKAPQAAPFSVVVECPGTANGNDVHRVKFRGAYRG